MPILALVIGILFVATGLNNTTGKLFDLLGKEFSGNDGKASFIPWLFSIGAVGALGYYDPIRRLANMFLVLIIIVLILVNKGFFDNLTAAFNIENGGKGLGGGGTNGGSVFEDSENHVSVMAGSAATTGAGSNSISDAFNKGLGILNKGNSVLNSFGSNALDKFTTQANSVGSKVNTILHSFD